MWKVEKRTQKEGLKNKMQKKYIGFFIYLSILKKGKREGQGIQNSLKRCKEK